jgi:tetratricopeptide (TPR) repeat protein/predicted aspartyl protease
LVDEDGDHFEVDLTHYAYSRMKYDGRDANNSFSDVIQYALAACFLLFVLPNTSFQLAAQEKTQQTVKKLVQLAKQQLRGELLLESEASLRRAIDIDPIATSPRIELSYVLAKQRRISESYDTIIEVVKAEPKNTRALAVLGATMLAAGRFKEARMLFAQAIRLNRREDLAWAGYGMVDFYENRIGESIANLREAAYREPNEPDYIFALAQVSGRAELYGDAAEAYRTFLKISKNTDSDRRARIKGLIDFLVYLSQNDRLYNASGREETRIPFDLEGNRPVLSLKVNNSPEPQRFVLDTGSGISVISEKTAKRLNIKPVARGGHAKGIGGDGKFEIVYGLIREIRIGDITIKNVPVYIRKFHSGSSEVDGYIGLSLISKFLTTVDYGVQDFILTRSESTARTFREQSGPSLPLRLTSSGFLSGEVQIEGIDVPLNFIVDTGASVSVISDEVARIESIIPFVSNERLQVIGSAGITDDVSTYRLPKVSFGTHSRTDITAVALNLGIINEASGFEQAGILGGNFLKNYCLTFDFKNSRVTFVPILPEK